MTPEPSAEARTAAREICAALALQMKRADKEAALAPALDAYAAARVAEERAVVDAVLYAMRCGCLFPVPEPPAGADIETLTRWGAMRNLHDKVATLRAPSGGSA